VLGHLLPVFGSDGLVSCFYTPSMCRESFRVIALLEPKLQSFVQNSLTPKNSVFLLLALFFRRWVDRRELINSSVSYDRFLSAGIPVDGELD